MRTRLFLRTAEFLWQEGHTAHETKDEAIEESKLMINVYAKFAKEFMSMPVIIGTKTENERFAGAIETYCIEAMMQDGKALQAGTSHFLGQNFSKAFDVKFANKQGKLDYVWATSWGVSTRLMGALIMSHSDDKGLVLPPKLAPFQVVIIPIYKGKEELVLIDEKVNDLIQELKSKGISYKYDNRDTHKPGWKFAEYELKGVPIRLSIGKRDIDNDTIELARRDTLEKKIFKFDSISNKITRLLDEIQDNLYNINHKRMKDNTVECVDFDDFSSKISSGFFVKAYWDGTTETENKIKEKTKATIRCIPLEKSKVLGKCIITGKQSKDKVIFAKSY